MNPGRYTDELFDKLLTCCACAIVVATCAAAGASEYLGPCAIAASKDGKTLYVANHDAKQLACVALPEGKVTRRIELPAEPTAVVLTPDGKSLIVTCAAPKSTIAVIDAASCEITKLITAGHSSTGPAISPDGKWLYVCNRFDNDVSVIDLDAGKEVARVKAVREPIAAAITPDGKTVLVANHLANVRTDMFFPGRAAPVLTVIDTETRETSSIELAIGAIALREICISPDGTHAYATHILCNFELTPTQVEMGWMNSNVMSVIDIKEKKLLNTVGLDNLDRGAGNPWGIALADDGKTICVGHAGSHELSVIDATVSWLDLYQMFTSPFIGAIPEDPKDGIKPTWRMKMPGKGPRGMAVVGSKVYLTQYFSDSLAVIDLEEEAEGEPKEIALGPKPELDKRRLGELLFNDATFGYQSWQSCASCHPDARTDALNWDLMNDGVGNFKNTKSMLLAHRTPPMMAEAVRKTAEEAVRAGIEHALFVNVVEEKAAAIDEYLKSLRPVPSPRLIDGKLSPAAQRGKELFESNRVGCHFCHPAPLYTDKRMHNVGSKELYGTADTFDTTTLVEVWRTAPYLHNGRYLTVKDLLVEGKHGNDPEDEDAMTEKEIDDLVEFVLSL